MANDSVVNSTRLSTSIDAVPRVSLEQSSPRMVTANWWVLRPFNAMAREVRMLVNTTIDASRGRYER